MISKRIDRKPENDNYGKLADYVRDAKHTQGQLTRNVPDSTSDPEHGRIAEYIAGSLHQGEKVLFAWHAGCEADDYNMAIKEVEATQSLNTRSRKEKTYHLVISFHPEDEDKLTDDVFRDIELAFAQALGFEEHQRHCGVHKTTDNIHIHIAYNMIHPVTLTRHEPYRDFVIRDKVCRALERKYGLKVDNGREQEKTVKRTNSRAQAMEAQSGQESFISYAQRQTMDIQAGTWRDFHAALAQSGIAFQLRGNGAIFIDLKSGTSCKASSVGREFSKSALEKKYGEFQEGPRGIKPIKASYDKAPRMHSARQSELWLRYKAMRDVRGRAYQTMRERQGRDYERIQTILDHQYAEIRGALLTKKDRARLYRELKLRKREALASLRVARQGVRNELNERHPATWTQFLQQEADKGDEAALALLRAQAAKQSREEEVVPFRSRTGVRQALQPLAAREEQWMDAQAWNSKRGVVVVRLACGEIREYGDTLQLRPSEPAARDKLSLAAFQFAEVRWGQEQALAKKQGNGIARVPESAFKLAQAERVR